MVEKSLIFCVDFDGTCVTHKFPEIGEDIGAVPVLKRLTDAGHRLILFTMRSDKSTVEASEYDIQGVAGNHLTAAVNWFKQNNIPLWGINQNPEQHTWTTSPKPYAHYYIDDAAIGCPIIKTIGRDYVDWDTIEYYLECMEVF